MSTNTLLTRLRRQSVDVSVHGDKLRLKAPPGTLTDTLKKEVRAHKAELLSVLRSPFEALERRIHCAADWQDLHAVVADAEVAWSRGELSGEEVDALAASCAQEAQCLPEVAPLDAEPRIYIEDLLPPSDK